MLLPQQSQQLQSWIVCVVLLFLVFVSYHSNHSNYIRTVDASSPLWSQIRQRIPFLKHSTTTYTPLIFFTVPKGLSPVCDEMEQMVSQIEHECQVKVERLDVLRHPENEAVLTMVTNSIRTASPTPTTTATNSMIQPQPPLLYHRESRQVYQVLAAPTSSTSTKASQATTLKPYIDKERIRAWAKGRYLSPLIGSGSSGRIIPDANMKSSSTPVVVDRDNEDTTIADLLLDEMALSPEQLKGKRLMEERTRGKAATATTTK